jgi:hypothetical protein
MLVGLGHPRTGTTFTAGVLSSWGLDVHHEHVGADGIVSWMAASGRSQVPFGDAVPFERLAADRTVVPFMVLRSPARSLLSVIAENWAPRSFAFRTSVIYERYAVDLTLIPMSRSPFTAAMASMVLWWRLCEERLAEPGAVFGIDTAEGLRRLAAFASGSGFRVADGAPIVADRNERQQRKARLDIDVTQVQRVPERWLEPFADACTRYGYPEDRRMLEEGSLPELLQAELAAARSQTPQPEALIAER